jgi:hypothetical protein
MTRLIVNPGYKVRDAANARDAVAGEIIDVPDREARILKSLGRASEAPAEAAGEVTAMATAEAKPEAAAEAKPEEAPAEPLENITQAHSEHRDKETEKTAAEIEGAMPKRGGRYARRDLRAEDA